MTFTNLLNDAQIYYESETSWLYHLLTDDLEIIFAQNKIGQNSVKLFSIYKDGFWFETLPTNQQIKAMFDKLDNTPYQPVSEPDAKFIDWHDYYGVNPLDFY